VCVRQWICRWHCSVHNICNGILPPHLASASSSRRSPPTPTPTSPDPAFPQGATVWCASSILQRTTPIEMVDVGPRCTCGADSTLARYSSRSTEEATPFAPKRGMPDPRVGGLHVVASLGCRRWCCAIACKIIGRKLATMMPMGVMSLPDGVVEVLLHCIPCPCCSISRARAQAADGVPREEVEE
jgi:hypothetical protein